MNSVILIGDDRLLISNLENIKFNDCISVNMIENRLAFEFIDGRVYFDSINDVSCEYELEEIKRIPIDNPRFISLAYTSKKILKKILLQIQKIGNLMIDDDMGNIIALNDYLQNFD